MGQVLDIAPLRSLVAVADCGGFHRAAAVLHMTQSAVSQHVRRIEAVVGGPVVERSGRGVAFTELGHRVLGHARGILAAHDAALTDLGAAEERVLLIGATEHGADVMLPALTAALGERLPNWRLRFRLDRNVTLADALEHGLVDLAVMLDGSGMDPAHASGTLALKWVSGRGFAAQPNQPLPVVIFSEPCTLREPTFAALDRRGTAYRIAAESADLSGLFAAVRSGLGVALLPMIGRLPDGLCLAEGLPPATRASVFVRGRAGVDTDVLDTVERTVHDVLAGQA
ncbi:LysR family transcriptional regulator [Mycolicibacterium conceptionense]|uniref:LysR family transcriptional regulator n=1 Tax=Mycolicibacterium conceptionense TaxID=451644 RepID=A0A1A1W141_9MYCO|nr:MULTISPECIES: LysR family transcriptional regulator [Mycolicibacterium]MCW1821918.1 LysR family transcriptional regulator [Mycolicibacterium senegalense]OBB08823.1 LysR family transcriptional regulator [Mycolicibacterium conceptionense]OBF00665.1 LysR family transcriptional regulator [Mycolicibacterium conceptionense]OBF14553.1 LysR family transcriptional regulator [Mycolicibacterium conceptionense]OBF47747.1 LysR family transcriptional regulator [Mycolicibacterium conceptionense]